jgi:hypothetical protein
MMGCKKCTTISGWLMLIAGVLFLLQNLNIWSFWNLQWYTVLFILWGAGSLAHGNCADCQAMMKRR